MTNHAKEWHRRREHRSFYYDLLRVPYLTGGRDPEIGLDCLGVCWEVLRRLRGDRVLDRLEGYPVDLPKDPEASTLRAHIKARRGDWLTMSEGRMPKDPKLGDIVLQMIGLEHDTPHVGVVVWNEPPVTLLTAHRGKGVIAMPATRAQGIVAVYRLKD